MRNGSVIWCNYGILFSSLLRIWTSLIPIAWEIGARIKQAVTNNAPPMMIWSRCPERGRALGEKVFRNIALDRMLFFTRSFLADIVLCLRDLSAFVTQ